MQGLRNEDCHAELRMSPAQGSRLKAEGSSFCIASLRIPHALPCRIAGDAAFADAGGAKGRGGMRRVASPWCSLLLFAVTIAPVKSRRVSRLSATVVPASLTAFVGALRMVVSHW